MFTVSVCHQNALCVFPKSMQYINSKDDQAFIIKVPSDRLFEKVSYLLQPFITLRSPVVRVNLSYFLLLSWLCSHILSVLLL